MPRADAQHNIAALLAAAEAEFEASGVDASVRAIAARAGVGTATLYRHFPQRADLVVAVFRSEVDACAAEAADLAERLSPMGALQGWISRYASFIGAKQGLAAAIRTGYPAPAGLPEYFREQLEPALGALLARAAAAGAIRPDVDPLDVLAAVAKLSTQPDARDDPERPRRMIDLFVDGMRCGVPPA